MNQVATDDKTESRYKRTSDFVDAELDRLGWPLCSWQRAELHGYLLDKLYFTDRAWAETAGALLEAPR